MDRLKEKQTSMTIRTIALPYGEKNIEVRIPERNLIGVFSPRDTEPAADVRAEIRRALDSPIGARPLREQLRGRKNAILITDDNTRLTPTEIIVPILLDECNAAGIPDSAIQVIIALGTHRFMTGDEIREKFGEETCRRVPVVNHPYRDPAAHIDLGTTKDGGRISINRAVVEADFKIGIGSIVPHHIPGFAGGAKIIQPGVSGEETTAYTHLLSVSAPRSYLGVLENPVRAELDAMARKVGMDTILNTVLNRHGEVVRAFFGDVEAAFRAGVERSREVYDVPIPAEADIVLASSHPCDLDFWQAHKTLYPSDLAVKAGGIVIVATPCPEGISQMHCRMVEMTPHGSKRLRQMVAARELEDEVGAALAIAWAQVREREEVWMVSDGICAEESAKLGFGHFADLQAALDAALARKGPAARVTVLTHAPDMLPRIMMPS
ncbi:MAG: nickel-dependent lactate racemase [Deltaproteobacteria bacterium]|nr:nickel-dependent lactate racemase [Deltaproteobacteria bacterium]